MQSRLPAAAKPSLGPDATGVGWIYQYALIDRSGAHDLAQLRSLQDWFLKYELITLPNVAEVATIGGMVKQYQVVLDPLKMASLGVTQAQVIQAIEMANQETGGAVACWPRPSTWCVPRAICKRSRIFAASRCSSALPACRRAWAMSRTSSSAGDAPRHR